MRWYRWLAVVPALGMLGGVPFANRVHPYLLGFPFLLAWIVIWVILTSAVMALIFAMDSARDTRAATTATHVDQSSSV